MTAPYFEDDTGERIARDHEGNNYYIPANITYKEWKKQQDSGIIKASKIPFAPAASIKEAETYARDVLGIPNASYKGCDLDTANAWNEGLKDTFERFPELRNNFGFVGEAHERNVAIKPIVQQQYFAELQKLNPGFTSERLKPYADQKPPHICVRCL